MTCETKGYVPASGRTSSTNRPCAGNSPRTWEPPEPGSRVGAFPVDGVQLATDDMERRTDVRPGGEDPNAYPFAHRGGQRFVVVLHRVAVDVDEVSLCWPAAIFSADAVPACGPR